MRVWKEWGFEDVIENNENYCLKVLTCVDEIWSSRGDWHHHPIKDETFCVIEGALVLEVVESDLIIRIVMEELQSYRIIPGIKHRFKSVGKKCRFIEASTHHSDDDTVRTEYKKRKVE